MMKRRGTADLLQECLAGFDAGLSPDECLSAFPERREEIEPLLRQALSLRVAFAASPTADFREHLKQNIMFASGREISAAFGGEPDSEFRFKARMALLKAGGDAVHESLRAVSPPRLAFWMNTKRTLLETAQQPRPQPKQPLGAGLRAALSAAVVVLALSLGGLAYLATSGSNAASVSAQYESLDQELTSLEQQAQAGQVIQPAVLNELSRRTTDLISRLEGSGSDPLVEKLPAIIQRQQEIVLAANDDTLSPELEDAQAQLNQAAEKVEEIRRAATLAPDESEPTPAATATTGLAAASPPASTPVPEPGDTPPQDGPPAAGTVQVSPLTADSTLGIGWQLIQTANLSLAIPADWEITAPALDEQGIGSLDVATIRADSPDVILLIQVDSGAMHAIIDGNSIVLRTEGQDGQLLSLNELVAIEAAAVPQLSHVLDTFVVTGELTP